MEARETVRVLRWCGTRVGSEWRVAGVGETRHVSEVVTQGIAQHGSYAGFASDIDRGLPIGRGG